MRKVDVLTLKKKKIGELIENNNEIKAVGVTDKNTEEIKGLIKPFTIINDGIEKDGLINDKSITYKPKDKEWLDNVGESLENYVITIPVEIKNK
jgi:hypothetical protein